MKFLYQQVSNWILLLPLGGLWEVKMSFGEISLMAKLMIFGFIHPA